MARGLFPCFWNLKSDNEDVDLDPVLLVSGIGGSILNSKDKKTGFETRVWVRILLANWEFQKRALSLYNPKTGYTECLDRSCQIVVPEDDYGLYAIDILDPSVWIKCMQLSEVYHFHEMIDMLVSCGYKKGTTLFGFGYDFRQSNRIDKVMECLKVKLATAYKASGGRKVNLISHSMGGLLVSCFLSLYHDVFEKYVSKWICIACPFQGAPGCINDALLTGLQFVEGFESYFFVSRWTMHQLLVECPSIYEMLPNPEFKWKKQPQIQVWRKQSESVQEKSREHHPKTETSVKLESYGPSESSALFIGALKDNKVDYNGKSVSLPFNLSILKWAAGTRETLNKALLPSSISFYNIYGTSFDTPFDVCYGSKTSPIEKLPQVCGTTRLSRHGPRDYVRTQANGLYKYPEMIKYIGCEAYAFNRHYKPQYSYVDGDGTVPSESTKADGFTATARVGVKATHRGLLRNNEVFHLIQQWLGITEKKSRRHLKTSKVVDESSSNER